MKKATTEGNISVTDSFEAPQRENMRPPSDPPDSASIAIATQPQLVDQLQNIRDAMVITPTKVEMIVTPDVIYKIIRVVNHFIKHVIDNHSDVTTHVHASSLWHQKWINVYPIIRSSRRSMEASYRLLFNDYSTSAEHITAYKFMLTLIDMVPHLKTCYDIKAVHDEPTVDFNMFQLSIFLYNGKLHDDNNPFDTLAEEDSMHNYRPFTDSKSISTWHTNVTRNSVDSIEEANIPQDVMVADRKISPHVDEGSQVSTASRAKHDSPAQDSNLSYSETSQSHTRKVTFTKKQQIIRDELFEMCNDEISKNMKGIEKTLHGLMLKQNDLLETVARNNTTSTGTPYPPMPTTPQRMGSSRNPRNLPSPQQSSTAFGSGSQQSSNYRPIQRSGTILFRFNGSTYELRDNAYNKNSSESREVKNKTDLIYYYEEMQSEAITYNIFMQQFNMLKPWIKYATNTLPPTCILSDLTLQDNTIEAYNRMKNALYSKISKSTFNDPEYKAIVKHGSIGKDGFEVLYELMTLCHPKLMVATSKIRDTNPRPSLQQDESIYEYAEKLTTWLTIEQINGLVHSDDQVLNIMLEEMRKETKYDLAVQSINSELTLKDTLVRTTGVAQFPEHLKLYHLPSTVLSYYSKEERTQLFPTDSSTASTTTAIVNQASLADPFATHDDTIRDFIQAIVKVTCDPTEARAMVAREGIDEICEGCGMFGHNVFKNGCDRCAKYVLIKRYLEKNPENIKGILLKYRKHQKERGEAKKEKLRKSNEKKPAKSSSPKRYNTRYNRARVQKIQDAIMLAVESDSESSDAQSYTSAQSSDTQE